MENITKERLLKIADAIEYSNKNSNAEMHFDMTTVIVKNNCGTSACIAGYAHSMFDKDSLGYPLLTTCLYLRKYDKVELFYAWPLEGVFHDDDDSINVLERVNEHKDRVPEVLRHMVQTENINWYDAFLALGILKEEENNDTI